MKFTLIHKCIHLLAVLFDERVIYVIYSFTAATLITQNVTRFNYDPLDTDNSHHI